MIDNEKLSLNTKHCTKACAFPSIHELKPSTYTNIIRHTITFYKSA